MADHGEVIQLDDAVAASPLATGHEHSLLRLFPFTLPVAHQRPIAMWPLVAGEGRR